jgi:hypothetical protein
MTFTPLPLLPVLVAIYERLRPASVPSVPLDVPLGVRGPITRAAAESPARHASR